MDGHLLFSLCDRVEEQVFQAWDNIGISSPAEVAEREQRTNETPALERQKRKPNGGRKWLLI